MDKITYGKLGVKTALILNFCLFVVMAVGTFIVIVHESRSLENELLTKGKQHSLVGAKMFGKVLEEALNNGVFKLKDIFDTNYVRIEDSNPPKYHTKYDGYLDKTILEIQDSFLWDESILYAVGSDRNGYIPTHNSRYQQPLSGIYEKDKVGNRTKRIFSDPIGVKAGLNKKPGFLQIYHQDTGEILWDISSPIFVNGQHWGGFRVGISLVTIAEAKKRMAESILTVMSTVICILMLLNFYIVNRVISPFKVLARKAGYLANGQQLKEEIHVTAKNEVGELQYALERLRLSMVIALRTRERK